MLNRHIGLTLTLSCISLAATVAPAPDTRLPDAARAQAATPATPSRPYLGYPG